MVFRRFPSTILKYHQNFCRYSVTRKIHVDLEGIFPPIVTPFNSDESIAYDKLIMNFEKWNKIPFRGYLVQGSNGEYISMKLEERVTMVEKVRKLIPSDKVLMAGCGCESTQMTIELTRQMADAGADVAVVVTPSFFKNRLTTKSFINHYIAIADRSPIPVVLYSVPANTGVDLPIDAITTLAQHSNIIGLKDSGGDVTKLASVIALTKDDSFQVLAGSASFLLATYVIGGVGGICALANVLGESLCKLHSLFKENNLNEAAVLQLNLVQPNTAVTKTYGVAGLKTAMELNGYYGGAPRLPLQPLLPTEKETLISIFHSNGFLIGNEL